MKLAFCFLSYSDIEQIAVWKQFFNGVPKDKYSIFLHTKSDLEISALEGCTVIPTQPTEWGGFSLVRVQQALFTAAHRDTMVYKFILLSGDAVPLFTFSTIYSILTADSLGRIHVTPGLNSGNETTVNKKAWPTVRPWVWAYADQWIILNRGHVDHLIEEWALIEKVFAESRFSDEHVYPILFNARDGLSTFNKNLSIYVTHRTTARCFIHHHTTPTTYHTNEMTLTELEKIYGSGALFLRKICRTARLTYDWTAERPLQACKRIILSPLGCRVVPAV